MARDLNKIELIGRLGAAPELRYTANGMSVANFSVATNNVYRTAAGDEVDEVQWHRCVAWGKVAEVAAKVLAKGHRLFLSGRMQYRKWTDPAGQERLQAEIVVDELIFLERAPAGASNGSVAAAAPA